MITGLADFENHEPLSSPMEQERADYPPVAPSFLADFVPSGHRSPAIAVSRTAVDLGPDLVQLLLHAVRTALQDAYFTSVARA